MIRKFNVKENVVNYVVLKDNILLYFIGVDLDFEEK
jgi:hypothetical protein